MNFNSELKNYLKANISSIYIQSYEWERFQGKITRISKELDKKLYFFNDVKGLSFFDYKNKKFKLEDEENRDIVDVLENLQENSIYILEEIHEPYLSDSSVVNRIKFTLRELRKKRTSIIIFSSILNIPKELEKELLILEMPLPSINDFEKLFNSLAKEFNISSNINLDVLSSLLGLTIDEGRTALSKAIVEKGKLSEDEIDILISQKEQIIKKSGHLEYFHPKENMNSIGGLDNLKEWLEVRKKGFLTNAKKYKLKSPKGIMLLGIPGTGKSLSAKAVSSSWKMPLVRLDFGKIFGSLVGESETNIRETIKIAESLSPCILWIDEIEKGLSGLNSTGDGGTSSRVFGTFLTWMQEKESEVFVLATANDISVLPPELLRKGRFDEIFFVDLPTKEERIEIIMIHLKNVEQDITSFNIEKISEESKGFSGAELEEVINEALFNIFDSNSTTKPILSTNTILKVVKEFYPLSKTMEERIKKIRKWAIKRTKLASKYQGEELSFKDTIPKLKQETFDSPFLED